MGEGAACLHGSTAGREGSGGEGARGAPSVLPRPGGMRGRTGGGGETRESRAPGAALTPPARRPPRPRGAQVAPSSRQGQRPRNQRLRCARSPPTRSIPRQTPSRGRSARLRGCSAAVATLGSRTRRPPARCPPSIPCGAPSPRRLGTAPARAPGAHPPLRARPGRAEREFPSPTGGTPRSRPAPHRGVSPRRATRVPGLRSAAPRPRGAATAPRGSQPHGQPPRCGIPTHRLRGPCPVHRPQHPCHRGPSPAARCRVPNRPADLSEPQGPQPRGQPLTQGVPAPLLRDPDPTNRSRHPCRGTRPRNPSPCRGVSPQSGAQPHTRPPLPRHGDPTPGTVPRGRDRRPRSTQTPHPAPLHGAATPGPTPRSPHGRTHGGPPAPRGPPAPPALTRACTAH